MWIDAGSRAETEETNGTAHFLEHLAFKVLEAPVSSRWEHWLMRMKGHKQEDTAAVGA